MSDSALMNTMLRAEPLPRPRAPMPAPTLDRTTTSSAWPVAERSPSTSSYVMGSSAMAPMSRMTKGVVVVVVAMGVPPARSLLPLGAPLHHLEHTRNRRHVDP